MGLGLTETIARTGFLCYTEREALKSLVKPVGDCNLISGRLLFSQIGPRMGRRLVGDCHITTG